MPNGQGVTSKAAFKVEKTTAWGTSTDCGAGDQIHFISESISHAIEQAQAIYKDGNVAQKNLYPIFKKYGGDLLVEAHYAGMESLIVVAMGMSHQDNSPNAATTTTYEHFLELSEDMSTRPFNGLEMDTPAGDASRRGTLCFEKTISVWELASGMIAAMNFEAAPERVTFSFTAAGKTLTFDSATNPNSAAWTLPTNTEQITWDDMTVYLKPRDLFTIVNASNDVILIDEGGGDITVDIGAFADTFSGHELIQLIAVRCNASGSLIGEYKGEYDEVLRRFRLYTVNSQTFSVSGATMNMAATIGMTIDSATGIETWSNELPVIDSYAVFDSGDAVGVSKVNFALENLLETESQDSESDLYILEPERNGMRRVTGTFEIPRYKNDDFLKAVNGFTTYNLWINFTGSAIDSENYEMNIQMPSIKFTNVEAPISGAELIKQTLAFEAEYPKVLNLVDYAFENFLTVESQAAGATPLAIGVGPDGIYVGQSGGLIQIWNLEDGTFTTSTDTGSNNLASFGSHGSKMFAGDANGVIYDQENGDWSISCDLSPGPSMVAFESYGDELFVLDNVGGNVYYYPDGDTNWSTSTNTTSNDANAMIRYGGSLFMAGSDGSTFTRIYEYSGGGHLTGWSTNCDIATSSGIQAACIHEGNLYVSYDGVLLVHDGVSFTQVDAALGISPIWMGSWRGNLMMIPDAASADLYFYDFDAGSPINAYPGLTLALGKAGVKIIGDTIYCPQSAPTLHMVKAMKEMAITFKNQNSTNPL